MNDKEMRELDAWIAEHVMGQQCKTCVNGMHRKYGPEKYAEMRAWFLERGSFKKHWPLEEPDILCDHFKKYSTDNAAAMELINRCLDETDLRIHKTENGYGIIAQRDVFESTLPLAIALFAKQLFSK